MENVTCVVLASGLSSRFGENKLLLPFNNTTLFDNTLKKISEIGFNRVIVIINDETFVDNVKKYNFEYEINPYPHYGQGFSIKLALNRCSDSSNFLFCVSDMPLLNSSTIKKMINLSLIYKNKIIRPRYKEIVGNPVFFPSIYLNKLKTIDDKKGGMSVIENSNEIHYLDLTNVDELKDVDTLDDYLELIDKKIVVLDSTSSLTYAKYTEIINNKKIVVFYKKSYNFLTPHLIEKKVKSITEIFESNLSCEIVIIDDKIYDYFKLCDFKNLFYI